jgi:uncharacterized membrane protein
LLMLEKVTPDTAVAVMSKFGTVVKTSLSRDAGQELQEARQTGSGGIRQLAVGSASGA